MFEAKMKEEEEALRKRFTEQVRMEENRFRQWEQRVCQAQIANCDINCISHNLNPHVAHC